LENQQPDHYMSRFWFFVVYCLIGMPRYG